ncbi:MAG TPA: hypothetical protein VGZ47_12890 [Gemmataceae bacterium]|jgi:hypothetical protein|nr:hypothetical protein [Gemmataceae bacterium]
MRKVCPQCQASFADQFLCPNCGIEMLDVPDRSAVITGPAGQATVHQQARGATLRLLTGIMVAQFLYLGLRQLATALVLTVGPAGFWSSASGQVADPVLQLIAVLLGGFITGAGNPRSTICGAAVGLVNAFLFVAAQYLLHSRPPEAQLLAGWFVSIVLASAGAYVGRWFWPALEDWPDALPVKKVKDREKRRMLKQARYTPTSWFRVLGGAALAVGCTVWAGPIRDHLIHNGRGMLAIDSHIQSQFVAWVISALAILIGGAFAGALSCGGVRHGFLVGILASVGIFVIHMQVIHEVLPAEHFFAALIQMPESDTPTVPRTMLFLITNTLLLGTLGGIFGNALLPLPPKEGRGSLGRGAI